MAQLKCTLIQGSARITDTLYVNSILNKNFNTDLLNVSVGTSGSDVDYGINYVDENGTVKMHIGTAPGGGSGIYGTGDIWLRPGSGAINTAYGARMTTTSFYPTATDALTLGTSSMRWGDLFANHADIKGELLISSDTTTSDDIPARIKFQVNDTTTGKTYERFVFGAYQDHKATGSTGFNFIINPGGALIMGGGESAQSFYSARMKNSGEESAHLLADTYICIESNAQTIGNQNGMYINSDHTIVPSVNSTQANNVGSIGSSANKWANMYATTFHGDKGKFKATDEDNLVNISTGKNPWPYISFGSLENSSSTSYSFGSDEKWGQVYCQIRASNKAGTTYYAPRFFFRVYSPVANSLSHAQTTGNDPSPTYETYQLPVVTTGLTSNKTYQILNTKELSPITDMIFSYGGDTSKIPALDNGTDLNTLGIGITRIINSTAAKTMSNTPNGTNISCGGTVYTIGGYNNTTSQFGMQIYRGSNPQKTWVRYEGSTHGTYGGWYKFPYIAPAESSIGGSTTSVYVNGSGQLVQGSAFVPKTGGAFTGDISTSGKLTVGTNLYTGPDGSHGLNMNNSDLVNVNGIFTKDLADTFGEGYMFKRSNNNWDGFAAHDGIFYFGANLGAYNSGLGGTATLNAYNFIRDGINTNWIQGRDAALLKMQSKTTADHYNACISMVGTTYSWEEGLYTNDTLCWTACPTSNYSTNTNSGYKQMKLTTDGVLEAIQVKNAVWNDYAEYRKTNPDVKYGQTVIDNDDGSLSIANARLLPGAQVVSDTWGHIMGETDDAKTPVAVAGRVLAYPYRDRNEYHAGQAVCTAPNGTIDIMTREEIRDYPDCIVGIVSEIPSYETWGSNNINVDGRIWIKIK